MKKEKTFCLFAITFLLLATISISQADTLLPPSNNIKIKSLNFNQEKLDTILRTIAEIAKINILIDPEIQTVDSLIFENTTAEEIFLAMAETNRLTYKWLGNVLRVSSQDSHYIEIPEFYKNKFVALPKEKNLSIHCLDFRNTVVADALKSLASIVNLNLVCSKDVEGTITVMFFDTTIQDALNLILQVNSLDHRWIGNTLEVTPGTTRPVVRDQIQIRNLNVLELDKLMFNFSQDIGTYSINPASNTISFTAEDRTARLIRKFIRILDTSLGSAGENRFGTYNFISNNSQKVTLGKNGLVFELKKPENNSDKAVIWAMFNDDEINDECKIGKFTYDSVEIGSGTSNPVKFECIIGIRVYDPVKKRYIKVLPEFFAPY